MIEISFFGIDKYEIEYFLWIIYLTETLGWMKVLVSYSINLTNLLENIYLLVQYFTYESLWNLLFQF